MTFTTYIKLKANERYGIVSCEGDLSAPCESFKLAKPPSPSCKNLSLAKIIPLASYAG